MTDPDHRCHHDLTEDCPVAVGGNPNAVDKMLAEARALVGGRQDG